jgi:hypothetical protein
MLLRMLREAVGNASGRLGASFGNRLGNPRNFVVTPICGAVARSVQVGQDLHQHKGPEKQQEHSDRSRPYLKPVLPTVCA